MSEPKTKDSILSRLGLAPSVEDLKLKNLVENSYSSVQVVGRGTVQIDPNEVRHSEEFQRALRQAKAIVSGT